MFSDAQGIFRIRRHLLLSGGWWQRSLINLFVFGMVTFSLYQGFGELEERAEMTAQNIHRCWHKTSAGNSKKSM